ERAGALHGDAARIGLAVLGVVDLPVPFVGRAARLHAEHDLNADEWPVAQVRVGIVLVSLRSARRRIVRLLHASNRPPEVAATARDADGGGAVLGEPGAARIGGKRAGKRAAKHDCRDRAASKGHRRSFGCSAAEQRPFPSTPRAMNRSTGGKIWRAAMPLLQSRLAVARSHANAPRRAACGRMKSSFCPWLSPSQARRLSTRHRLLARSKFHCVLNGLTPIAKTVLAVRLEFDSSYPLKHPSNFLPIVRRARPGGRGLVRVKSAVDERTRGREAEMARFDISNCDQAALGAAA